MCLDKFLFTNRRFLYQEDDAANSLEKAKLGSIQPVEKSGHVLPIYGSDKVASVPRYLVGGPQPVGEEVRLPETSEDVLDDYQVKLIGFGGNREVMDVQGFSDDFELRYRAPELLFDSHMSRSADIWSLACLVCISVSYFK